MDVNKSLVNQIINLRKLSNLSQEDLAMITHMPPTSISRIESGRHNLTMKTLGKLCWGLNAEISLVSKYSEKVQEEKKDSFEQKEIMETIMILTNTIEKLQKQLNKRL